MLQTMSPQYTSLADDHDNDGFDLQYLLGIVKRRAYYFAIPFVLVVMVGFGVVAIQRPIYRAQGKILVMSPEIPVDLVRPTVTEVANQRVQVIQQRIMARDSLMAVVNKFDLFPRERQWMSGTELLDLVRSRMEIKPVALDLQTSQANPTTIAFTLSFDYEVPVAAMRVAGDFLTTILSEDAATRNNSAADTTKFLETDVKRLRSEHDAVVAQIASAKQRPPDPEQTDSEEAKAQMKILAEAEATLAQAQSEYSDQYPLVIRLKKKIAALKRTIAAARKNEKPTEKLSSPAVDLLGLDRREAELSRDLDDATRKLNAARLGQSMEQSQAGERLQVIEQPSLPTRPVRPQLVKWYAAAFIFAGMIGAASLVAAEMLDGSIRRSRDLAVVVDKHLLVSIPYIASPGEQYRKRRNLILLCTAIVAAIGGGIAFAVMKGVSVDFSSLDQSWPERIRGLLH